LFKLCKKKLLPNTDFLLISLFLLLVPQIFIFSSRTEVYSAGVLLLILIFYVIENQIGPQKGFFIASVLAGLSFGVHALCSVTVIGLLLLALKKLIFSSEYRTFASVLLGFVCGFSAVFVITYLLLIYTNFYRYPVEILGIEIENQSATRVVINNILGIEYHLKESPLFSSRVKKIQLLDNFSINISFIIILFASNFYFLKKNNQKINDSFVVAACSVITISLFLLNYHYFEKELFFPIFTIGSVLLISFLKYYSQQWIRVLLLAVIISNLFFLNSNNLNLNFINNYFEVLKQIPAKSSIIVNWEGFTAIKYLQNTNPKMPELSLISIKSKKLSSYLESKQCSSIYSNVDFLKLSIEEVIQENNVKLVKYKLNCFQ
jgi:hypothetical protein